MAYRETAQVKARKAAQREALLRTAETLVREGGFAAMTMQTVADRAGVGVGTLYRYFDNKATLAAAVFAVATQREVDAERLRYRAAYAALYQRVLDQGVAAGELPPQSTALAAAALVGAIAEALVGPLAAPLNDARLADHLAAFCLRAVGAPGKTQHDELIEAGENHERSERFTG